jgi:hypothetical protein
MMGFRLTSRACALACAAAACSALAIVPGITTTDWPYAGRYGDVSLGTSGVAIGDRWVLTAGHVAWQGDADGRFQMDGGPVYSSIRVIKHPTDDIALIELSEPMPGWYPIYTGNGDVGATATLVGYGVMGSWNGSDWDYGGGFGTKRRGANRYTWAEYIDLGGGLRGTFIYGDFDGNGIDAFGDGGPVTDESTLGGGDSGGPSFINDGGVWKVAGIHSWVGRLSGGPFPPRFGSIFGDVQVSAYATWINGIMPRRVTANTLAITAGTPGGGGLAELHFSDNSRLTVNEAPPITVLSPSAEIMVTATSPTASPTSLKFRVESNVSAIPANSVTQQIRLWNYTSGMYELVDTRMATSGDSTVVVAPVGTLSRFVQAGTMEMRARIGFFDPGTLVTATWSARFDLVIWEILP